MEYRLPNRLCAKVVHKLCCIEFCGIIYHKHHEGSFDIREVNVIFSIGADSLGSHCDIGAFWCNSNLMKLSIFVCNEFQYLNSLKHTSLVL